MVSGGVDDDDNSVMVVEMIGSKHGDGGWTTGSVVGCESWSSSEEVVGNVMFRGLILSLQGSSGTMVSGSIDLCCGLLPLSPARLSSGDVMGTKWLWDCCRTVEPLWPCLSFPLVTGRTTLPRVVSPTLSSLLLRSPCCGWCSSEDGVIVC